jgi:hypothetical protein
VEQCDIVSFLEDAEAPVKTRDRMRAMNINVHEGPLVAALGGRLIAQSALAAAGAALLVPADPRGTAVMYEQPACGLPSRP